MPSSSKHSSISFIYVISLDENHLLFFNAIIKTSLPYIIIIINMYRAQKTKKWCHILALNFKDEEKYCYLFSKTNLKMTDLIFTV